MKNKTVINYHVATDTLKEALATAYDVYSTCGLVPDSIDLKDDETMVAFNAEDALFVRKGEMTEKEYADNHSGFKSFESWSFLYFHEGSNHLDVEIPLHEALDDYCQFSGIYITSITFMRKLRDFVESCSWIVEINPHELCQIKPEGARRVGRILHRMHDKNGKPYGSPVDFIYMRSVYSVLCEEMKDD